MKVITLDTVKTLLGISESTYDTALSSAIVYIDMIVKQITNNRYNYKVLGDTEAGSKYVYVYSDTGLLKFSSSYYDDLEEYLEIGAKISGTGIPAGAYIDELYYNSPTIELAGTDRDVPVIELNEAATATNTGKQIFIGINKAYEPIIAKAAWWRTLQVSTDIRSDAWKSKRMGPVNVTKTEMDAKLDGRYGVPIWLTKALPHYHRGY